MQQVEISASYYASTTGLIDLPEGKTWDDVKTWFVKWDTLYLDFKDGSESTMEINSETMDVIDWKRPADVSILEVDSEGVQTGKILAEQ